MASPPIAQLVDAFLAAPKELAGIPDWHDTGNHGVQRLILPITIDGVSAGAELEVQTYPNAVPARFRFILKLGKCIWRVDYAEDELHTNSLDAPAEIAGALIVGPHYHAWVDNRRFATHSALPDRLKNARQMPEQVRSFHSALRWFCDQVNILQPPNGLIEPPRRTRLV